MLILIVTGTFSHPLLQTARKMTLDFCIKICVNTCCFLLVVRTVLYHIIGMVRFHRCLPWKVEAVCYIWFAGDVQDCARLSNADDAPDIEVVTTSRRSVDVQTVKEGSTESSQDEVCLPGWRDSEATCAITIWHRDAAARLHRRRWRRGGVSAVWVDAELISRRLNWHSPAGFLAALLSDSLVVVILCLWLLHVTDSC